MEYATVSINVEGRPGRCWLRSLLHASAVLKGGRDVVLTAVAQNGYALHYASAELQGDRTP